jgi:hypothetical protein
MQNKRVSILATIASVGLLIALSTPSGRAQDDWKHPQLRDPGVAAFVDPAGHKVYVANREDTFKAGLSTPAGTRRALTAPREGPGTASGRKAAGGAP